MMHIYMHKAAKGLTEIQAKYPCLWNQCWNLSTQLNLLIITLIQAIVEKSLYI